MIFAVSICVISICAVVSIGSDVVAVGSAVVLIAALFGVLLVAIVSGSGSAVALWGDCRVQLRILMLWKCRLGPFRSQTLSSQTVTLSHCEVYTAHEDLSMFEQANLQFDQVGTKSTGYTCHVSVSI